MNLVSHCQPRQLHLAISNHTLSQPSLFSLLPSSPGAYFGLMISSVIVNLFSIFFKDFMQGFHSILRGMELQEMKHTKKITRYRKSV